MALIFPLPPRPNQLEAATWVHESQLKSQHLLLEAPTGSGKSLLAVVATGATLQIQQDAKVVYATRTNSQQRQLRLEGDRTGRQLIPLVGRKHACPHFRNHNDFVELTSEELGRACRKAKELAKKGEPGGCPFYANLETVTDSDLVSHLPGGIPALEAAGLCGYEGVKRLLPAAREVVLPTAYLLEPGLRTALHRWIAAAPGATHLILDEAHHLPEAARQAASLLWTKTRHERAKSEAEKYGNPEVGLGVTVNDILDALEISHQALLQAYGELGSTEIRVPQGSLEEEMLGALNRNSVQLIEALDGLLAFSERIREAKLADGGLPRSNLGTLAQFLLGWIYSGTDNRVQIVSASEHQLLRSEPLDSADCLDWLSEYRSTTHMSGTLAPLRDHANAIGVSGSLQQIVPPSWAPDALQIFCTQGVARKYIEHQRNPESLMLHQDMVRKIVSSEHGRIAIFYPSRKMLEAWDEEGFHHDLGRPLFMEEPGMTPKQLEELVQRFSSMPRAILLGVLGGRLSEGIDYPGDALEAVIITGIPYPPPNVVNKSRIDYIDRIRPGRGWQEVIHVPVGRVMRQAIGRIIRGPEDRGRAYIVDERGQRFNDVIPGILPYGEPNRGEFTTADNWNR